MKKIFKIGIYLFIIGVVGGVGTYLYVFHKPHRNIEKEAPAHILTAEALLQEFITAEDSSYRKYGDKVVQVSGEIVELDIRENGASLVFVNAMEGVSCAFDSLTVAENKEALLAYKSTDKATVKGKCDGYDMIMGVVLTRCVLVIN